MAGMVFAVVAFTSVDGVWHLFTDPLGGSFQQIPTLTLAILETYIVVKIHEAVQLDKDENTKFS